MIKNNCKNILGIETSCDDTAIGIVTSEKNILSNIVINQNSNLTKYGGIIPELAARDHLSNIDYAIHGALNEAELELQDMDLITATGGPGLIGGVIVRLSLVLLVGLPTDGEGGGMIRRLDELDAKLAVFDFLNFSYSFISF